MKGNKKNIPHLGEVPASWESGHISDLIAGLESGVSVNGEDRERLASELAVLKISAVTYGTFNQHACKPIISGDIERAKCNPKSGQILISRSNTAQMVGASAYIEENYPWLFLPDKLWQTIPIKNRKLCMRWLAYYLASPRARYQLSSLATGTSSSMKNITKEELLSLPIPIPTFEEQVKIARLLSTWEEVIDVKERLLQAKQSQLTQLSRKLLFGSIRLGKQKNELIVERFFNHPSDWALVKVGDVAQEVSVRGGNSVETVLSCSKYDGFVNSLDYFGKQVFSNDTSNYKVIRKGQFGYPSNHIEEGSIGLVEHCELGIVSPIYVVFEVNGDRVHAPYLYKLLKTDVYRHIFQVSTSSSVDRRGSLRWSDFSRLKVPLPPLAEQKEIAEAIYVAEEEIKLLKQLAEKYRVQKRGLMQKLLTGEWRVNTDEEVV